METKKQLPILRKNASPFEDQLLESQNFPLKAISINTMQVNIGRKCNQACMHCHVNASPEDEREMTRETVDLCLDAIRQTKEIEKLDLTGGAPEMNKNFTYFIREAVKLGRHIINRCNLTILEEPGFDYLYDFFANNNIEIIASLPHFRSSSTDRQRGKGVFEKSITALQKLNKLGYGDKLVLNLVYNPTGIFLSSPQKQLEREFKEHLKKNYDIVFNNLFCLNNIPLNRFLERLVKKDCLKEYMDLLVNAFNPCTIENLMCRHQISVGYDGALYDCDFNQMLEIQSNPIGHIKDFDYQGILNRSIITANHCYGCTAGSGSS